MIAVFEQTIAKYQAYPIQLKLGTAVTCLQPISLCVAINFVVNLQQSGKRLSTFGMPTGTC